MLFGHILGIVIICIEVMIIILESYGINCCAVEFCIGLLREKQEDRIPKTYLLIEGPFHATVPGCIAGYCRSRTNPTVFKHNFLLSKNLWIANNLRSAKGHEKSCVYSKYSAVFRTKRKKKNFYMKNSNHAKSTKNWESACNWNVFQVI